jgi:hypothetical protein
MSLKTSMRSSSLLNDCGDHRPMNFQAPIRSLSEAVTEFQLSMCVPFGRRRSLARLISIKDYSACPSRGGQSVSPRCSSKRRGREGLV